MNSFCEGSNSLNGNLYLEEMKMCYNFWGFEEAKVLWYPFYNLVIDDNRSLQYDDDEIVWQHDVWNLMDIKEIPNH